jgi:tetrahydromethanopterin S-methyltransferase subunit G
MKFSLDYLLEEEGPFKIMSVDRYNELIGKLGDAERRVESLANSNDYLQRHVRKLEDRLDEQH